MRERGGFGMLKYVIMDCNVNSYSAICENHVRVCQYVGVGCRVANLRTQLDLEANCELLMCQGLVNTSTVNAIKKCQITAFCLIYFYFIFWNGTCTSSILVLLSILTIDENLKKGRVM